MKISGIVIVKNGESLISDCLKSLSFCDEIIVVDAGSKDKTKEIAQSLGAKVIEIQSEDFSQIRNYGLEKTQGEWILYVDVDERISYNLKNSIRSAVNKKDQDFSAFKLRRKNFYFGNYEWPYIEKLERLFKRENLKGWRGKIHESPVFEGKVGELNGFLYHYTHSDLSSMLNKTIDWSKIEAETRFKSRHPKMTWWRFPRVMLTAFLDSYIRQGGYKIGVPGLIESIYQAFSAFITYAKLWELQQKNEFKNSHRFTI